MRMLLTAFVAAVALAAGVPLPAAAADEVPTFKLVAKDGQLDPAVIEVPAGKRFKLEVSNQGKSAMEFESKELKQEKVVAPGKSATLTIGALKAGEYKFVDEFHEDVAKGRIIAK